MKIKHLFVVIITVAALYSCGSTKDIAYFQDIPIETQVQMAESSQIKLQPDDRLTILVNSQDPQLTAMFNLTVAQRTFGATSATSSGSNNGISAYTIDPEGNIDFPVIGKIHIAGLSRSEVAAKVKNELITRNLVKDPTVTVEYANLQIAVLGEVNNPGRIAIDRDTYTIIDAIAQAGDLTINGLRKNVTVLRREGNQQQVYKLDLCNDSALVKSPAYYIKQGDYVYVEPNEMRKRSSTVNGNSMMTPSFWISIASFLASMAVLIFK